MLKNTYKLEELIHRMTASEKRFFKLYASTFKRNSSENSLLSLFDEINEYLLKGTNLTKINELVKSTSNRKHRLFNKLLDALVMYRKNNETSIQFANEIAKIKILYEHRLYTECEQRLLKLEEKAEEACAYSELLQILDMREILTNTLYDADIDLHLKLEAISKKILAIAERININVKYREAAFFASKNANSNPYFRELPKSEVIKNIHQNYGYLLTQDIESLDKQNLYLLIMIYTEFALNTNAFDVYHQLIRPIVDRALQQFGEDSTDKRLFSALINFLTISFRTQKLKNAQEAMQLIAPFTERIKTYSTRHWIAYLKSVLIGTSNVNIYPEIDYNPSSLVMNELKNSSMLEEYNRQKLFFFLVQYKLRTDKFEEAFNLLSSDLVNHDTIKINTNYYFTYRVYQILNYWERQEYSLAERSINGIRYTLKAKASYVGFAKEVVQYLERVNRYYTNGKVHKKAIRALHNYLVEEDEKGELFLLTSGILNYLYYFIKNDYKAVSITKAVN